MTPAALPAALLVDLDGTLVDSEPFWQRAVRDFAAAFAAPWSDEQDAAVVGAAIPDVAARLIAAGVPWASSRIEEWLHDRVAELEHGTPPWRPGARDLLAAAARAGVPSALVTMTYGRLARVVAAAAPAGSLGVVVAGDDVRRGKPDPEAYLTAAAALGVPTADCVAVEDSATGVRAALASGATTWCVQPATVLPDDLAAHPRLRRVADLAELAAHLGLGDERPAVG